MHLGYLISWLHPILVHFPIVFLISALVVETIGWSKNKPTFSNVGKGLLATGCILSLFTFVTGNFAEVFAVRGGTPHAPVDAHGIWAMVTTWLFILLTVWRFYLQPKIHKIRFRIYFSGLIIASGFLGYTAHQGGLLVFDHAANVMTDHEVHALDTKDLRDLYQEQTLESIIYSEMMHHIFGWLVLAMSLFLIASKISPEQTHKLWRGGPFILLAGGFFLMIFSDTDAWPLSNARPIYDKEVLQHKIFATLMLAAGILSLVRRHKDARAPSGSYHLGLALLALIGGGLLFTHVHSVAPYSNRAVGVYLHHLTLGIIALCAGTVSFWEAMRPNGPRWRIYLWPGILLVESMLLIFYNENIPWFVQPFTDRTVFVQHDPAFKLILSSTPEVFVSGRSCQLKFILKNAVENKVVRDLEIVHEHPLHLMIVSRDLSFFDHIHPILQQDGSLTLDYSFPYGGEFILFADLVPKGFTTQSFRIPVQVQGSRLDPQSLVENSYQTFPFRGREILLFTKPIILAPGQPAYLRFALYENQKGISDLQPFLGCFGHCIVISQDTQFYLHAHPEGHQHGGSNSVMVSNEPIPNAEDGLPRLGSDRQMMLAMGMTSPSMSYAGPEITFPVTFPKSGIYKVWGQFRHRDEIITAPFVIKVP